MSKAPPIPSFARDFPRDDALDALVRAFARGDYALVRAEAPKLAQAAQDERVALAARILRQRVEADPIGKGILGLSLLVLVVLSAWWIAHDEPPGNVPVTPPRPTQQTK